MTTRDRGSGTVYALVVIAVLAIVAMAATTIGGAVIARHRAMAGADLAALAAADALARADPDPCASASRVARRQSVSLVSCTTSGHIADVVVAVPVRGLGGELLTAQMRSRAGPPG